MRTDAANAPTRRSAVQWRQLLRFGLVGLASNALGYLLYLALTQFGLSPQATVGVLYPIGALLGYAGNKRITFAHRGEWRSSGLRYALVHVAGMGINLFMLWLFVDVAAWPHHWVQAAAVLVVAAYLFVAMRGYVFASRPGPRATDS